MWTPSGSGDSVNCDCCSPQLGPALLEQTSTSCYRNLLALKAHRRPGCPLHTISWGGVRDEAIFSAGHSSLSSLYGSIRCQTDGSTPQTHTLTSQFGTEIILLHRNPQDVFDLLQQRVGAASTEVPAAFWRPWFSGTHLC